MTHKNGTHIYLDDPKNELDDTISTNTIYWIYNKGYGLGDFDTDNCIIYYLKDIYTEDKIIIPKKYFHLVKRISKQKLRLLKINRIKDGLNKIICPT